MPTRRTLPPLTTNPPIEGTPVAFVPVQVTQPLDVTGEAAANRSWLKRWGGILGGLVALAIVVFGMTQAWAAVSAHTKDEMRHLDPAARMKGGDVAYRSDVTSSREAMLRELRALRRDLRNAKVRCHKVPGDGMDCTFDLPEGE